MDTPFRGIERRGQGTVLSELAVEGDSDRDRRLGRASCELQPVAAEPVVAPLFRRGHAGQRAVRHADVGVGRNREPPAPAHPDHERLAFRRRRRAEQLRPQPKRQGRRLRRFAFAHAVPRTHLERVARLVLQLRDRRRPGRRPAPARPSPRAPRLPPRSDTRSR